MDQVKHTMLVAQAKAEIVKRMLDVFNFSSAEAELMQHAKEIASEFGLDNNVLDGMLKSKIPQLRTELETYAEQKAGDMIASAIKEAETTHDFWSGKLTDIDASHAKMIAEIEINPKPTATNEDVEFELLEIGARKELISLANEYHEHMMKLLRQKEHIGLEYCFQRHLVTASTSDELAKLYQSA